MDGNVKIFLIGNSDNTKLVLKFLVGRLIFGLVEKVAGGVVKKVGGVETSVSVKNFLPMMIKAGVVAMNEVDNLRLVSSRETGDGIDKTVGVAGNKIDFLAGNMKGWRNSGGNILPPSLGGFGIV